MMEYSLVIVPSAKGVRYGVYEDLQLLREDFLEGKTLDALTWLWFSLKQEFEVKNIFYARGPGSLSALKLLHIFVHTLALSRGVRLFAVDSFYFHPDPIFAFGKQYFVKNGEKIELKTLENIKESSQRQDLPKHLRITDFHQDLEPLYILPSV